MARGVSLDAFDTPCQFDRQKRSERLHVRDLGVNERAGPRDSTKSSFRAHASVLACWRSHWWASGQAAPAVTDKEVVQEGLIHAIESIRDMDIGLGPQAKPNYSAKDHKGFDHVIPTVVHGGKAVPFTDWTMVAPK
jgi:hypothetical protein